MSKKLTRKEKFPTLVVLMIGIILLVAQIASIASSRSDNYSIRNGSVQINRSDLLADIRTYITIVLSIGAAVMLFKRKKWGWIIGFSLITLFLLLAGWGTARAVRQKEFNLSFAVIVAGLLLMMAAFVSFLLPDVLKKYRVGKATFLPTLVFLISLAALYWFLQ